MARAAIHQPPRQHFAVAAERAGDQIASVRLDVESRRGRFAASRDKGVGKATTTLPICLPLAMSRNAASMRDAGKARKGSGVSAPFSTRSANLLQHLARQRFVAVEDRVHRDDVERRIARSGQSGMREFW